jgi:hypothetical protein
MLLGVVHCCDVCLPGGAGIERQHTSAGRASAAKAVPNPYPRIAIVAFVFVIITDPEGERVSRGGQSHLRDRRDGGWWDVGKEGNKKGRGSLNTCL